MNNEDIIAQINKYQSCDWVHNLTCGNYSNHKLLEQFEEDGKVKLKCPDCDYIQEDIPFRYDSRFSRL